MKHYVLSVLVNNHSGVLSRIAGLFSRRGYNIDSLSVGITENESISRMTITVYCNEDILEQICKQLAKLHDVISVQMLTKQHSVRRELAMIKVKVAEKERAAIIELTDIFRARIVDVSPKTLTIEVTGDKHKVEALIELIEPYGIKEMVRAGLTALGRGELSMAEETEKNQFLYKGEENESVISYE